jgi:hypothetical protein
MSYDWKERWRKDLAQIMIHIAECFKAIEDDNLEALDDAIEKIFSLVEPHA